MALLADDDDSAADLPPTEMIYYTYEGNFQLVCDAKIVACDFIDGASDGDETERREVKVSLNRTVLYAQGGGQPTDIGTIEISGCGENGEEKTDMSVTKVLLDRTTGVASHTGTIESKDLPPSVLSWIGKNVKVSVHADNRRVLSECHTAGHLVDTAMNQCKTMMLPTKAYHFLEGPYVEYKGKIPAEERGPLLEKLQASFQDMVATDIPTEINSVPRPEAEELCNREAGGEDYFKLRQTFREDETVRIVSVAGLPVPCGGTHVKSTGELKGRKWGITGFRCKKGVVRVKYCQDWNQDKCAK